MKKNSSLLSNLGQKWFKGLNLFFLSGALLVLWFFPGNHLTPGEQKLWDHVRAGEKHISKYRRVLGTSPSLKEDPWELGLIGTEWSPFSTTLGDLAAKRTACSPAWAVQFSRWFNQADLEPGDRIALFSSGSFPGMLVNALAAAESYNLKILLVVSLGSSSWGANHPDLPWPILQRELQQGGFINKKPDFYTLGGNRETGMGMPDQGKKILIDAAKLYKVPLIKADSLQEMVRTKSELVRAFDPKLFINIGGSHANLGDDGGVLELTPGLLPLDSTIKAGNGVVGYAVSKGIRVIHILNIKELAAKSGIPFDSPPGPAFNVAGPVRCSIGLTFFVVVLWHHRRWGLSGS